MKVIFHLVAMTRQEYSEERDLPDNTTDAELDEIAENLKHNLDGSEYVDDVEYWEEQPPRWEKER